MRHEDPAGLILLVEDNRSLSEMVGEYLESRGFGVDYAGDGMDGYRLAAENSYDVIVLDLMLPRLDGLELCRRLRNEAKKATPVLMLTARDTLSDKVNGLDAGADDYLVKPFAIQELEARVRALIRRERRQVSAEVLKVGDLVLDTASLRATRAGTELQLSPIGLRLLTILMRESPRVVTRRDIEREIWGDGLPDAPIVVDEAYVDFGGLDVIPTAVALVQQFPNVLVTQTLSKSRSLAGLRVGFAIGQPELVEALTRVKDSFNSYPLDRLALVGASAAMDDEAHYETTRRQVIASREALTAELGALGFEVLPSAANFVFARHPGRDAAQLAAALRERSIIVRHFKAARRNSRSA